VDAVKSILRLEPELADEVAVWEAELVAFAEREGMPVNGVASQAIDFPVEWQNVPLKPAHWKPPMPEQLSSEGQAKLASLCQEHPKVENVWRLLNGRRTAAEICSRTALPAEAAVTYLRLLLQEGWIS
jgi:hypothetical protein